ncbi:MAG: GAF domain-containing protein [Pseudomonadota bacterium]
MLSPPFLENEQQRFALVDDAPHTFVPREERFDRITRTAMRLMGSPVAVISVVDDDAQWIRSAQGLDVSQTPKALAFCEQAALEKHSLVVPDTHADRRFDHNPLVVRGPRIRSCLGIPLHLVPGVCAGTLCVMSTRREAYSHPDIIAMQDLARMTVAELRLDAMSSMQKRLLVKLDQLERRARLDPLTGCWNVRGFRELVAMAVADAARSRSTLALCYVRIRNFDALTSQHDKVQVNTMRQLAAQVLRQRLPDNGALAALGGGDFCALVPGPTALAVEDRLAQFTFPHVRLEGPGIRFDLELHLGFGLAFLHEMHEGATATEIWATALANIDA